MKMCVPLRVRVRACAHPYLVFVVVVVAYTYISPVFNAIEWEKSNKTNSHYFRFYFFICFFPVNSFIPLTFVNNK